MGKTSEIPKPLTAHEIADLVDKGEDISRFFTKKGKMMSPIQRVNAEFRLPRLEEGDGQED
jgi:hypothetical protein